MKKTMLLTLMFILLSVVLTSCWNKDELNDLAIVIGLGLDKKGDEIEITVQVVDPTQVASKTSASSGFTPVVLYSSTGKSVPDAVGRLTEKLPRKIYFAQLWVVIISEQIGKEEGVLHLIDFLERNPDFRNDFYFAVAHKVSAKQLLSVITSLDRIPAKNMFQKIKIAQEKWSPVSAKHLDDMLNDLLLPGKELVLNSFSISGDMKKGASLKNLEEIGNETNILLNGLAVFKDDKLIGLLNESESRGYSILTNQLHQTISVLDCEDGNGVITLQTLRSKSKIKANKKADGRFQIEVPVRVEADVISSECSFTLTAAETLTKIEEMTGKKLISNTNKMIQRTKKLNSDIVGFGAAIRRAYPDDWKKIQETGENYYKQLEIKVIPEIHIRRIGSIGNSPSIKKE
ncbi:Ger(x)C family spore germination protein [Paenibacillus yanchengensis]|uniref:Ger(X)C family spore germination protein n=1 Tax=Paenibacillus yanchengensis TaxID=2035833 RepID=A0ABW4YM31_9BACL